MGTILFSFISDGVCDLISQLMYAYMYTRLTLLSNNLIVHLIKSRVRFMHKQVYYSHLPDMRIKYLIQFVILN